MSRVVKKPEERKNELLDIALRLFMKKGYENTSVRDIYSEANGSFGMFYHHFRSKEEIFAAAMDKYSHLFTAKLSDILLDEEVPFNKRMSMAITHYVDFLKGRDKVRDKSDGAIDISVFRELNLKMVSESIRPIESFLEEGVRKKIFQTDDIHMIAIFVTYGIWGNIYEASKRISSNKDAAALLSKLPLLFAKIVDADDSLLKL